MFKTKEAAFKGLFLVYSPNFIKYLETAVFKVNFELSGYFLIHGLIN